MIDASQHYCSPLNRFADQIATSPASGLSDRVLITCLVKSAVAGLLSSISAGCGNHQQSTLWTFSSAALARWQARPLISLHVNLPRG
jgi:hypothetical protein